MGLRRRFAAGLRNLAVRLSDSPAATAAREIVRVVGEPLKGFERSFNPQTNLYRWFQIERGRFNELLDDWTAIEESPIVDRALWSLAEDATAEPFTVECDDQRALDEIKYLFDGIQYWGQKRTEWLAKLNGLGNHFLIVDVNFHPVRKRNMAEIVSVRTPECQTMFRMSNEQGVFPDWEKAYLQIPSIEAVENSGNLLAYRVFSDGRTVLGPDSRGATLPPGYAGLVGSNRKYVFRQMRDEKIWFRPEEVIHGRLRPGWQRTHSGYGISAQRSSRLTHNAVMMSLQDLALARKFSAFNRLAHIFDPNASDTSITEYIKRVTGLDPETKKNASGGTEAREAGPADAYFMKGGKIEAVDVRNTQLTEIKDLWLHIDLLAMGLGYPMALLAFGAERMNGLLLDRFEQRLKRTIAVQHQTEEYEFIRPLISRALFYAGKAVTEYEVKFPAISFEDENKLSKRVISEIQGGTESRLGGRMRLHKETVQEAMKVMDRIEEEYQIFGPPGHYTPGPENLDKGKKGVEGQDPETQDIAPTENTTG